MHGGNVLPVPSRAAQQTRRTEAVSGFGCGARGTPTPRTCSQAAQSCWGLAPSRNSAFRASSAHKGQETSGMTGAQGTSGSACRPPITAAWRCCILLRTREQCLHLPLGGPGPNCMGRQQKQQQNVPAPDGPGRGLAGEERRPPQRLDRGEAAAGRACAGEAGLRRAAGTGPGPPPTPAPSGVSGHGADAQPPETVSL